MPAVPGVHAVRRVGGNRPPSKGRKHAKSTPYRHGRPGRGDRDDGPRRTRAGAATAGPDIRRAGPPRWARAAGGEHPPLEIRNTGLLKQVTIQSFDWGSLIRMREIEPRLPLVALTNYDFLQTDQPGASPWLGGLDIDDFGGDPIRAIRSFGAAAFSPVHGFPQNGKVTDPGYRPYVTREMVAHAHRYGIKVIPWTVDDVPTMAKLIDDGVDGIITDYPDRLRGLLAQRGYRLPKAYAAGDRPRRGRTHHRRPRPASLRRRPQRPALTYEMA
ncbi:hypothetical protein JNW88_05390 [Micromonospora sp. ATA32]|nr:hypothetical protein [Micromonospora sp. ATA32]